MTAAGFRAEAQHLRAFAFTVINPEAPAEIRLMIAELERRSWELYQGSLIITHRPKGACYRYALAG